MTALEYAKRFPHARSQTIAYLIVQERKTKELMAEVNAQVQAALVSHLAEILPDACRADRERIEEAW